VLQVATYMGSAGGVGDLRAILRSTVAAIERAFGKIGNLSPDRKLSIALSLLDSADEKNRYAKITGGLSDALSKLQVDDRHYWISTFYTLLMDASERREKAIYFTPPAIVGHLIRQTEAEGLDLSRDVIVDPAAGGAAFVSSLAGRMAQLGCTNKDIRKRLRGFEINRHLAELGEALVCERLRQPYRQKARGKLLRVADSLNLEQSQQSVYDAVFVNPPYGRLLGLDHPVPADWSGVSAPGHINKYALFIGLALRLVKPGGLVAAVCPSSYIAGPLFGPLRRHIRATAEALRIDVLERKDVFHDVTQDACVAIFRRRKAGDTAVQPFNPICGRIDRDWKLTAVGTAVPSGSEDDAPWVLPDRQTVLDDGSFHRCSGRLSDYGVTLKSGNFVWNREKHRLRKRRLKTKPTYPLIWAHNVKLGQFCLPASRFGGDPDFVTFNGESSAIIRTVAVVLQRTTNNRQVRRLIAAVVPPRVIKKHGGFVAENHTILILPSQQSAQFRLLCRLLNTNAVDRRYRRVAGTASISISSLRDLPLPKPQHLSAAVKRFADFERAVEEAYCLSSQSDQQPAEAA
jgi:adenine-specific DNA-methyltransferase